MKFLPIENTPRSPQNSLLFQKSDSFGFGLKELIIPNDFSMGTSEMGSFYNAGGPKEELLSKSI